MDDLELQVKRWSEMAQKAYRENRYFYTGFLTLSEQSLLHASASQLEPAGYTVFGGYEYAERKMAQIGTERIFGYQEDFPIACIYIAPAHTKFADVLTHRDYLGAVLNLGLNRNVLGDIVLHNNSAYLYCVETMAPYIEENLIQVKHTRVVCTSVSKGPEQIEVQLKYTDVLVSSERLDVLLCAAYHLSRSECETLFREKRVFIDGRCIEKSSVPVKPGEIVSLRGKGRFRYEGVQRETKKGRKSVTLALFV